MFVKICKNLLIQQDVVSEMECRQKVENLHHEKFVLINHLKVFFWCGNLIEEET